MFDVTMAPLGQPIWYLKHNHRVLGGEEWLALYLTVRSAGGEQDVAGVANRYQSISFYKHR